MTILEIEKLARDLESDGKWFLAREMRKWAEEEKERVKKIERDLIYERMRRGAA